MNTHELNLHFGSLEECRKWEEENIVGNIYKDEVVLMIMHEEIGDEVILKEILTV